MKRLMHHRTIQLIFALFLTSALSQPEAQAFPSSPPEQEGVSSTAVLSFIEHLEKHVDAVHSVMILRHGKVITEGWWAPYDAQTPHLMHSLSKSFTSTAMGLAIGEGKLSLDDPVISFFPEDTPKEPSWQLKAMRIRDLMIMSTGHRQEPFLFRLESNWVRAFLHAEVEFQPGTHFKYNSAATYMLSAILQNVTGETLVDYLDPRLFQPLGISKPDWDVCPDGINTGGWGLRITTEDIAKLGQLYLQRGNWEGTRILSEEWVDLATSKQTSNGSNPKNDWSQGYGFQFWRCRHNCYRGDGAFGQFCIVMPDQDAVVAVTSGANDMGAIMNAVWDFLLPAMKPSPLAANDAAHHALRTKLGGLSLPWVSGEPRSALSERLAQRTFQLIDNDEDLKSVAFKLHEGDHRIIIETSHGIESISLGTRQYLTTNLHHPLPHAGSMRKRIGASGAWIEPQVYQARIYFCKSPARMTYTFRFTDDRMTWSSDLKHSLFAPKKLPELQGR